MSSIDRLIEERCRCGVDFGALGDLAQVVSGLSGKTKADFAGGSARFISYKNAFANLVVDQEASDFVAIRPGERQNCVHKGDVVFTASSESTDEVGMSSVVASEPIEPLYLNSFCFALRFNDPELLLPGFCKYLFRGEALRKQIRAASSGVTRINISKSRFLRVRVPLPPLEVQREIVRVLDQFIQLEADLEVELEAELEARRRQYEYYRYDLLSFDSGIEWPKLGDVAHYVNGKAHERLADPDGDVPMITARFISRNGEANRFVRLEDVQTPANMGDIALVLSDLPNGRALARTFFVDRDNGYAINQRVARLRVKDPGQVAPRFLYHVLDRNPGLLIHDNGVDQTHLSKVQVTGLHFPLPPFEEQRRIVEILDKFHALVDDLSVGLPAELAARRKQYEYYRDKLLTFEEAKA